MAKKAAPSKGTQKQKSAEDQKGLAVKVELTQPRKGKVVATVTLLQDGKIISSDFDWVLID